MRCSICDYSEDPQVRLDSYTYRLGRNKVRPREPDQAFICDHCYEETQLANEEFEDEYTKSVEEFFGEGSSTVPPELREVE